MTDASKATPVGNDSAASASKATDNSSGLKDTTDNTPVDVNKSQSAQKDGDGDEYTIKTVASDPKRDDDEPADDYQKDRDDPYFQGKDNDRDRNYQNRDGYKGRGGNRRERGGGQR